jgi:hypothetical protein
VKLVSQVGRAKGGRVSQVVAMAGNHDTVPNSDAKNTITILQRLIQAQVLLGKIFL